jgi:transposase-like protein
MRSRELKRMLAQASKLTPPQRQESRRALGQLDESAQVVQTLESRAVECPQCHSERVVRNGHASGLQRYKCRACLKTFNALTATPLARLQHKDEWELQADVLRQGLSVHQAAEVLRVAPSTAFRWRHRFLQLAQGVKAQVLQGVVEADETYFLRSSKGQQVRTRKARHRGGSAAKRGLSDEQEPVLVARDRSGATADFILERANKVHVVAALAPVLASDAVLCTDSGKAFVAAARHLGVEHDALNLFKGLRVQGAWHIQNANAYHARLKNWMRRFKGLASSYLASYLGWFRALDRQLKVRANPRHSWLWRLALEPPQINGQRAIFFEHFRGNAQLIERAATQLLESESLTFTHPLTEYRNEHQGPRSRQGTVPGRARRCARWQPVPHPDGAVGHHRRRIQRREPEQRAGRGRRQLAPEAGQHHAERSGDRQPDCAVQGLIGSLSRDGHPVPSEVAVVVPGVGQHRFGRRFRNPARRPRDSSCANRHFREMLATIQHIGIISKRIAQWPIVLYFLGSLPIDS